VDLAETKRQIFFLARLGGVILVLLTGCVRPVAETPTTPTASSNVNVNNSQPSLTITPSIPITPTIPVATNDTITVSAADLAAIERYISTQSGQALQPETLEVWWRQPAINPEEIFAVSFRNPSGLNCIGVAMGTRDAAGNLNVFTGGASCATELGATALVSSWLLVAQIQPITVIATVGQLFNAGGTVSGATVIFPDGSAVPIQSTNIINDRFLHIRTGTLDIALEVVFYGQDGAEIRRQRVTP